MAEVLALDVTERERHETQPAYQATHDALTGLLNRSALVGARPAAFEEMLADLAVAGVGMDG